jgi:hypothetical protein
MGAPLFTLNDGGAAGVPNDRESDEPPAALLAAACCLAKSAAAAEASNSCRSTFFTTDSKNASMRTKSSLNAYGRTDNKRMSLK